MSPTASYSLPEQDLPRLQSHEHRFLPPPPTDKFRILLTLTPQNVQKRQPMAEYPSKRGPTQQPPGTTRKGNTQKQKIGPGIYEYTSEPPKISRPRVTANTGRKISIPTTRRRDIKFPWARPSSWGRPSSSRVIDGDGPMTVENMLAEAKAREQFYEQELKRLCVPTNVVAEEDVLEPEGPSEPRGMMNSRSSPVVPAASEYAEVRYPITRGIALVATNEDGKDKPSSLLQERIRAAKEASTSKMQAKERDGATFSVKDAIAGNVDKLHPGAAGESHVMHGCTQLAPVAGLARDLEVVEHTCGRRSHQQFDHLDSCGQSNSETDEPARTPTADVLPVNTQEAPPRRAVYRNGTIALYRPVLLVEKSDPKRPLEPVECSTGCVWSLTNTNLHTTCRIPQPTPCVSSRISTAERRMSFCAEPCCHQDFITISPRGSLASPDSSTEKDISVDDSEEYLRVKQLESEAPDINMSGKIDVKTGKAGKIKFRGVMARFIKRAKDKVKSMSSRFL